MKLTLQGIMGSLPGGQSDLGRNTTCLVLTADTDELIIDAGSGITAHFEQTNKTEHHVLFTHYHMDHIVGLPFVPQIFDSNHTFHLYGPQLGDYNTSHILPNFLVKPFLPIPHDSIKSNIHSITVNQNQTLEINGFTITPYEVNHPGKCLIYKIERKNKKVCILTDLPLNNTLDDALIKLCASADLIYADAFFTNDEIHSKNTVYGHSTIEAVTQLATLSSAKKCVIGHHRNNRMYHELKRFETDVIKFYKERTTIEI